MRLRAADRRRTQRNTELYLQTRGNPGCAPCEHEPQALLDATAVEAWRMNPHSRPYGTKSRAVRWGPGSKEHAQWAAAWRTRNRAGAGGAVAAFSAGRDSRFRRTRKYECVYRLPSLRTRRRAFNIQWRAGGDLARRSHEARARGASVGHAGFSEMERVQAAADRSAGWGLWFRLGPAASLASRRVTSHDVARACAPPGLPEIEDLRWAMGDGWGWTRGVGRVRGRGCGCAPAAPGVDPKPRRIWGGFDGRHVASRYQTCVGGSVGRRAAHVARRTANVEGERFRQGRRADRVLGPLTRGWEPGRRRRRGVCDPTGAGGPAGVAFRLGAPGSRRRGHTYRDGTRTRAGRVPPAAGEHARSAYGTQGRPCKPR